MKRTLENVQGTVSSNPPVRTERLDVIKVIYSLSNAQVTVLKTMLKFTLKELLTSLTPLNAELNPICHLPALLGAHHILHFSRIRFKKCNFSKHV